MFIDNLMVSGVAIFMLAVILLIIFISITSKGYSIILGVLGVVIAICTIPLLILLATLFVLPPNKNN